FPNAKAQQKARPRHATGRALTVIFYSGKTYDNLVQFPVEDFRDPVAAGLRAGRSPRKHRGTEELEMALALRRGQPDSDPHAVLLVKEQHFGSHDRTQLLDALIRAIRNGQMKQVPLPHL